MSFLFLTLFVVVALLVWAGVFAFLWVVDRRVAALEEDHQLGFAAENVVLLGFSQGACLAVEFAARNARRYGGVVAFSGGLIGPDGTPRNYPGALGGTPVFLGCSDVDAHIPEERVMASAGVMRKLGGTVDARIYPGMGHTVNEEELGAAKSILEAAKRD